MEKAFPTIEELEAEKTELLKSNPKLQATQDELDRMLDGCVDQMARADAAYIMMGAKMMELLVAFAQFGEVLDDSGIRGAEPA